MILINEQDEITETAIANLVLELDGRRVTPALECGLLPGIFRQHLLESGQVVEARVPVDRLKDCMKIFRIKSVRKWEECELVD